MFIHWLGMFHSFSSNVLFHKNKFRISTDYGEYLDLLAKESPKEKRGVKGYITEFLGVYKVNTHKND